jgi:CheY-like chemotaxis protein
VSKYRILVIDDEPDILNILSFFLKQDYEVVTADNGFDALEKLDRVQPDVILSDIDMPIMDGLKATRLMRRHPDYVKTPICILSGSGTTENMKEAYANGVNFFLTKPFEGQRVLDTLKMQIDKHGTQIRQKNYTIESVLEIEKQLKQQSAAPPAAPPQAAPSQRKAAPPQARPAGAPKAQPAVPSSSELQRKLYPIPTAKSADGQSGIPRVLIVDDDETVVLNLCRILKGKYEIIPIVDPLEAMEKLVKWEPDIMITNLNMPALNGLQLVRMLKGNPTLRLIEIIFTVDELDASTVRGIQKVTDNPPLEKAELFREIETTLKEVTGHFSFKVKPKRVSYNDVANKFMKELEDHKKEKQREYQRMYTEHRYKDLRGFIGSHFSDK